MGKKGSDCTNSDIIVTVRPIVEDHRRQRFHLAIPSGGRPGNIVVYKSAFCLYPIIRLDSQ